MKKLLILLFSIMSSQVLANLDVYSCDVKQNIRVFDGGITEMTHEVDSFLFSVKSKKIMFSEDHLKRPKIAFFGEFDIRYSNRDGDRLSLKGQDMFDTSIFSFNYGDDGNYGYLVISHIDSGWNRIRSLIARCVEL